jgi:hypothetical protein
VLLTILGMDCCFLHERKGVRVPCKAYEGIALDGGCETVHWRRNDSSTTEI